MRVFNDSQGGRWQAAPLEASYGHILLVFSPFAGAEVRQVLMEADYMVQAGEQLVNFTDDELRGLLADSVPWTGRGAFS